MLSRFLFKITSPIITILLLSALSFASTQAKVNCDSILQLIEYETDSEKLYQHLLYQIRNCPNETLDDAYTMASKAYKLAKTENFEIPVYLNWEMAYILTYQKKYLEAADFCDVVIAQYEENKDTLNKLRFIGHKGKMLTEYGNLEASTELFKVLEQGSEKAGDADLLANSYLCLAWNYNKLNKRDLEFEYINKTILLNDKTPIRSDLYSVGLFYLAEWLKNAGDLDTLNPIYQKAFNTIKSNKTPGEQLFWYYNISRSAVNQFIEKRLFDQALAVLNDMKPIAWKMSSERQLAFIHGSFAKIIRAKSTILNAKTNLDSALYYAEWVNDYENLQWVYGLVAQYYKEADQIDRAYTYLQKQVQCKDSAAVLKQKHEWQKVRDEFLSAQQEQELEITRLKLKNARRLLVFLGALTLAVIAIIWLFQHQFRLKAQQRLSELKRKNTETTQKALLQQMNPHFIFNTLNSIQFYMFQNDKEATNDYLSKFSNLIRRILDNSQKSFVAINDEFETVKYYLELEQLRFKNRFIFEFSIDEEIDTLLYKIPAMLIQPFVENAIVHGFMDKKEQGFLRIELTYASDNYLLCSIDDNGIGRKKALEIKTSHMQNHQSLGTKITTSRIQLVNELYGKDVQISYEDKYNGQTATGTKVLLQLPIIT